MLRLKLVIAIGAVLGLIGFVGVTPAGANPVTNFTTVFNTDVAYAGLGGMRGTDGSGTITLSGVTGTVTRAYLYWHGPTNLTDPNSNAAVSFAGSPVTGTNIGTSSSNCWGFTNSQAYRADVTSLVHGNGGYALANFTKPSVDMNGVSLVVFYDDGNPANNHDVVLFNGNDSNQAFDGPPADPAGWDVTLDGINYTSGDASLDLIVADGQAGEGFDDGAVVLNGQTLAAAGQIFSGDTVPNASASSAAGTNGGLWDIKSFPVTSELTPGPNTLHLTSDYDQDCLSLIVAAVNLPAGSAPDQPTTTTTPPTTAAPTTAAPTTTAAAAKAVAATPAFTG
jgi:hypothetical protein